MTAPIGEKNNRARLDRKKVRGIVQLSNDGVTQKQIAKQYGVSQGAISNIMVGKSWTHVTEHLGVQPYSKRYNKLTWRTAIELVRMHQDGYTQAELSEHFGVSQPSISNVIHGKHWCHITEPLGIKRFKNK